MIIIKTLLSSVLTLTLFSAITMAADSNSHAERQQATSTPLVKTASAANGRLECKQIVGNSTANAWNTGEICFATDTHSSKGKRSSSSDLRAANSISQNRAGSSSGAECISAGGSTAMTEAASGFCMASDLNTAQADVANFSVDNGLSVAGMQFLQLHLVMAVHRPLMHQSVLNAYRLEVQLHLLQMLKDFVWFPILAGR